MYSPPSAISSGIKHEAPSSAYEQQQQQQHQQHRQQHSFHKLPSLPPFPSLVSSLGERHPDYPLNSSKSSSQTASPASHRDSSAHLFPQHPSHRDTEYTQAEISSNNNQRMNATNSATTSTTPRIEDYTSGLPLPAGYSDPYHRSHSRLSSVTQNGLNSGQQVEWESSIRTGSSASTSEPPLSPGQNGGPGKRRRLSAAHDIHPHHSNTEHNPEDVNEQPHLVDELSSMVHAAGSASPTGDEKGANGRTLKQTKRAAQNRAAQQAFRKRKEERIRELEEKEKVLHALVARENEIIRKEKILAERERAVAAAQNGPSSLHPEDRRGDSSHQQHPPSSSSATNDWDRAFANAPVASPLQHIAERLEASNRANEVLRAEIEQLKDRLSDKANLIDSLRRSLEDLGAENRSLREAVGRS